MKRITPSEQKRQELINALYGSDVNAAEKLSQIIRKSSELAIQAFLEGEQTDFLGRVRYQRKDTDKVYRNGYESRKLRTAEGMMEIQLPQVRGLGKPYRSKLWFSLSNKSAALEHLVTEMWVGGLSVRDIEYAFKQITGERIISDSTVSRITNVLYDQYEDFIKRDLSKVDVAYLLLDGVYEPLKRYGCSKSVLCAWSINMDGSKELLSIMPGSSESESNSLSFLRDMVSRGLRAPITITTDGSLGLKKAVSVMWPKSLRLRCWFHKMQNIEGKIPDPIWPSIKSELEAIRDSETYEEGKLKYELLQEKLRRLHPGASRSLAEDSEALLNVLRLPVKRHRLYVRTTNLVERAFEEVRRRDKVIPKLADERMVEKLVYSVLIRLSSKSKWSNKQFGDIETLMLLNYRKELGLDASELEKSKSVKELRKRYKLVL